MCKISNEVTQFIQKTMNTQKWNNNNNNNNNRREKLWCKNVRVISIETGALITVTKDLKLEDLAISRRVETIFNYNIIEIDQNTEKSPGDL